MVNGMRVNQVEPRLVFEHPVAKLDELGFSCTITFVRSGTRITLDDKMFITDKDHWLDMDVDDMADAFGLHPDDLELWFTDSWPSLYRTLDGSINTLIEAQGGVVTAAATANLVGAMASVTSATASVSNAMVSLTDATTVTCGNNISLQASKIKLS